MTELINEEAVCRTVLITLGLLIIVSVDMSSINQQKILHTKENDSLNDCGR